MRSILQSLSNESEWLKFYEQKLQSGYMSKFEARQIESFISNKQFLPVAKSIEDGFCFERPQIKLVNKSGTDKKRTVYCFSEPQMLTLKLLATLLHKYDDYFCPLCFSFRKNLSIRRAIRGLIKQVEGRELFCYKLDISNYFNSIDIELLLPKLKKLFNDDPKLYDFFEGLLVWQDGTKHGVMAGTPTSPFLANVYLSDLDRYFYDLNVPYARYSDDIIVFGSSHEQIMQYKAYINEHLAKMNLTVNAKKEKVTAHCGWQFLGIEYNGGEVDLSDATLTKIKGKIRRKAKSIYRWKQRKNAPAAAAMRVLIRAFNKKFFEDTNNDLTWSRWYFPLLTTDKGLKKVDSYLQMWLRFLVSGKHNKKNYKKAPYTHLKQHGYTSLVNRFYEKEKGR